MAFKLKKYHARTTHSHATRATIFEQLRNGSLDRQMYEKMVRTTANFAERSRSSVARPAGGSSCTRSNLPCLFLRQVDALGFGGAARSGAYTARYLS